jgi:hypothetical protein
VPESEISCREFVEVATDFLEESMSPRELDLVEEHLVLCDWCRDHLAQLEATVSATRGLAGDAPPAPVLQTLVGAFREAHGKGHR